MARRRKKLTATELRRLVERRSHRRCEYCHAPQSVSGYRFHVEHIVPIAEGGSDAPSNRALVCASCNNHKYTKTQAVDPVTGELVDLFYPRKHRWSEHFAWNEDCTFILGLTPIGRATIEALQLNRPGLVNLRRILFSVGEHPPVEPT